MQFPNLLSGLINLSQKPKIIKPVKELHQIPSIGFFAISANIEVISGSIYFKKKFKKAKPIPNPKKID